MNHPTILTAKMVTLADLVVTIGCSVKGVCPAPLIASMWNKLVEWRIEDPKDKSVEKVREIRDEIERKMLEPQSHS